MEIEKVRRSSTVSPKRSIRTGSSPWAGKTSMIPPRSANSALASTRSVRSYPRAASSMANSDTATSSPLFTTTGHGLEGLSRCTAARTDATITPGASRSIRVNPSQRCAIVARLGDTCSKGSVSQAGIRYEGAKSETSSTNSSASRSEGTMATTGPRCASAASANERAPAETAHRPDCPTWVVGRDWPRQRSTR